MEKLFLDFYPTAVILSTVEQYGCLLDELRLRYGVLTRRTESLRESPIGLTRRAESLSPLTLTGLYQQLSHIADSLADVFGAQMVVVMGSIFIGSTTNMFRLYRMFLTLTASQIAFKLFIKNLPSFLFWLWVLSRPILASVQTVSQVSSSVTRQTKF
jgi:7tm Chemosensory receptor